MALATLRDLMIDELRDLCSGEHQLVKLLPQMAKAARVDPGGRRCRAMEGLVAQARDVLAQEPPRRQEA